jgi:hypothetical protein
MLTFLILCMTTLAQNIVLSKKSDDKPWTNFDRLSSRNIYHTDSPGSGTEIYDWGKRWNEHPTRKIILGSVFIFGGLGSIAEALMPAENRPYYEPVPTIGEATFGVVLASLGTAALVKGIKLKKLAKLKVTAAKNGIGLTYEM